MKLSRTIFGSKMLEFEFGFRLRKLTEFELVSRILDKRTDIGYMSNAIPGSQDSAGRLVGKDDKSSIDYDGWIHAVRGQDSARIYFGKDDGRLIAVSLNGRIKAMSIGDLESALDGNDNNANN